MAIIHITHNFDGYGEDRRLKTEFPDGAYCPLENHNWNRHHGGVTLENAIVLYKTHHGLCLFESESNGYHDSDFYMTVWNPDEKKPERILFATTRGWTYPCYGSSADATDEVKAEYAEWKKESDRRYRIQARWDERRKLNKLRDEMQLNSRAEVWKLRKAVGLEALEGPYRSLLKVKNFRSNFRKSLCSQVREWIAGERVDDNGNEYKRPLSRNQEAYL